MNFKTHILGYKKKIVILNIFGQKSKSVIPNCGTFDESQTNYNQRGLTTKTFFFRHATTGFFKHIFEFAPKEYLRNTKLKNDLSSQPSIKEIYTSMQSGMLNKVTLMF